MLRQRAAEPEETLLMLPAGVECWNPRTASGYCPDRWPPGGNRKLSGHPRSGQDCPWRRTSSSGTFRRRSAGRWWPNGSLLDTDGNTKTSPGVGPLRRAREVSNWRGGAAGGARRTGSGNVEPHPAESPVGQAPHSVQHVLRRCRRRSRAGPGLEISSSAGSVSVR
jgi:hypothetical protein